MSAGVAGGRLTRRWTREDGVIAAAAAV